MSVPLRNVYYLLCYAWDRLDSRDLVDLSRVPGDRAENLLGAVLAAGVSRLLRQGLDRGYRCEQEETRRPRGKLLASATIKRGLRMSGRLACEVEDLTRDVPHNRVLKAAMNSLARLPSLDGGVRKALAAHCTRMSDVHDVRLESSAFRPIQLHRNLARYSFLVEISRLVASSLVPSTEAGQGPARFVSFLESPQIMGDLFERFVRNFLRLEQNRFGVAAEKIPWVVSASEPDLRWLPEMRSDVTLSEGDRRLVLETKYYAQPYRSLRGSKKLISGHLYQLCAYLQNLHNPSSIPPAGMLLYAQAGETFCMDYEILGERVLVRSLDLDQDWSLIHADLMSLALELSGDTQETSAHEGARPGVPG